MPVRCASLRPAPPGASPLAIATQEIDLYPGLSAATNLTFFGHHSGVGNIEEMLADVVVEPEFEP